MWDNRPASRIRNDGPHSYGCRWYDEPFALAALAVARDAERWVLTTRESTPARRSRAARHRKLETAAGVALAAVPFLWAASTLAGLLSGTFL